MGNDKLNYKQYAAFINREVELKDLRSFIDKEPSEILFIHGPKSSGKTTLLYKFLEQVEVEQKLDVKFLNLRKMLTEFPETVDYNDFLSVLFNVEDEKNKAGKLSAGINVGFFKIDSEIERKIRQGKVDPFKVMEKEFIRLKKKGIKPVLIIDELQALDNIYLSNGRQRRLIIELFNFFVAMTKESHLAHIMVASSDGYFINRVYTDSKLKKASEFYKVDYLNKEDVMDWLRNLKKYSKIKDYTLTEEDAGKIWELVGGSVWEIQYLLSRFFEHPIDEVLTLYKKKMKGLIAYYIGVDNRKEALLRIFLDRRHAFIKDFMKEGIPTAEIEELLPDMVRNNILYFDPTEATYFPQGESYRWGIRLYFDGAV
ncbi:MAG: AAA family ATPase [Candidatus Aminicenantes bacterium]|nr:AAA family ATPase [Candidatus Aminicenantes bacterium]